MSMNYWSVSGFGIDASDLDVSVDKKISFIKKYLPAKYEEMMSEGEDNCDMGNTSEYMDFCNEWISDYEDELGCNGFGTLFAEAIQENEDGFDVEDYTGEDEEAVMYVDRMPWEMSDRVKKMTFEDMEAVFRKYLNELDIKTNFDRQTVHYWG